MTTFLYALPADALPGPPLIGNNLVFYSAVGAGLLLIFLVILRLRRRRQPPVDTDEPGGK